MGRTLKSLYRERRTMKNIVLLSLLTLAILQPLAEAQRGLPGRLALRCRGCSGLPGREAGIWSSASAIFGKDNPTNTNPPTIEPPTTADCNHLTVDNYHYTYYNWQETSIRLTFEARGSNDVTVLFSFCDGCNGFEIVIGGWRNTYSVIREYKQEEYVNKNVKADRTQTPNILSTTEMREFWIDIRKAGNGVKIEVGKGSESSGFMSRSWTSNPYNSWPPTNVAFAAWNNKMDYKFCLNLPDCQAGWSSFNGGCYKSFSDSKTWDEAQQQCVKEEAHLVSIHSEKELKFVVGLNGGFPWLGARRDPENHDDFVWSDGTPWDYSNWGQGEPDDWKGIEDCVYETNVWNTRPCNHVRTSICKKAR